MSFDIKKLLIDGKNIKLTFYNSFYNKAIPYRPLTDYEMELITAEATKVASESCGINKNEIKEIIEGNSTSSKSVNFLSRYFLETKVLTIYYAMKDFCDNDFTVEDVKRLYGINEFYEEIRKASDMKEGKLKDFF